MLPHDFVFDIHVQGRDAGPSPLGPLLADIVSRILTHAGCDGPTVGGVAGELSAALAGAAEADAYRLRLHTADGQLHVEVARGDTPIFHASRVLP